MAVGEWDQRHLCPDGACVGVIGPDGTCKVCGRAAQNWGDERKRGLIDPPDEDDSEDDDDVAAAGAGEDGGDEDEDEDGGDEDDGDEDDGDEEEGEADEGEGADRAPVLAAPEWGSRQLCPDGSCVGVIGPNGRCKVCGRRAEDAAGAESSSSSTAPVDASTGEPDGHSGS
jgi:hypothetical protein